MHICWLLSLQPAQMALLWDAQFLRMHSANIPVLISPTPSPPVAISFQALCRQCFIYAFQWDQLLQAQTAAFNQRSCDIIQSSKFKNKLDFLLYSLYLISSSVDGLWAPNSAQLYIKQKSEELSHYSRPYILKPQELCFNPHHLHSPSYSSIPHSTYTTR